MKNKKFKKYIEKLATIMFAFIAFAFTITGALAAGSWTVTLEHANNSYSNDAAWAVDAMYIDDDMGVNTVTPFNASRMSVFTQANGTWVNNATYISGVTRNNSLNGSVVNFTIMTTADRTVVFQFVIWNNTNATGARIATSNNYTFIYDATNPALTQANKPAYERVTITYTPTDAVSISNCSVDSGAYSAAVNNTEYTYLKTYSNQGNYQISTICYDRAGNSITNIQSFTINFAAASAPVTYDAYGNVIPQTAEQQQAYQQQIQQQQEQQQGAIAPSVSIDTQKVNTFWQGIVSFFRKLFGG